MTQITPRSVRLIGVLVLLFVAVFAAAILWRSPDFVQGTIAGARPHLLLKLKDGIVNIELRPDLAPNHVERIVTLARRGFFDGIVFHRVIAGFMAQTGDPTGTGTGGSDLPDLAAEFSGAPFARGTLGMARATDPGSANSQFFITLADAPHLNGQYTVFGTVVAGMEFVDAIKKGDPGANGMVAEPDWIVSLTVAGEE
ncbi:MAG: peptidylprolyl isomerase [Cucumibacter sp.]